MTAAFPWELTVKGVRRSLLGPESQLAACPGPCSSAPRCQASGRDVGPGSPLPHGSSGEARQEQKLRCCTGGGLPRGFSLLLGALFCQGGRKAARVGGKETVRNEKDKDKTLALVTGVPLVSCLRAVSAGQVEGSQSQRASSGGRQQKSRRGERAGRRQAAAQDAGQRGLGALAQGAPVSLRCPLAASWCRAAPCRCQALGPPVPFVACHFIVKQTNHSSNGMGSEISSGPKF